MDKYIKPIQQATNPLLLPPELFTNIGSGATRRRAERSWTCDYMDIGGRATQEAITETAHLIGHHFSE